MSGRRLSRANLELADMVGVDLTNADLSGTDLTGVDLSGATLCDAFLHGTKFHGTNLAETEFGGAKLKGAAFLDVDLSVAKGLESVRHQGPSTVGTDTLMRSRKKTAVEFSKGMRRSRRGPCVPPFARRENLRLLFLLHQLQQQGRRVRQTPARSVTAGEDSRVVRARGHRGRAKTIRPNR